MSGSPIHRSVRLAQVTLVVLACNLLLAEVPAQTSDSDEDVVPPTIETGQSLPAVLRSFQQAGLPLVYGTNLVNEQQIVRVLPNATTTVDMLNELLASFELTLKEVRDHFLVVRAVSASGDVQPTDEAKPKARASPGAMREMEQVDVVASHYRLDRDIEQTSRIMDRQALEVLPAIGSDPLRALHRLPGAATQGISAKLRFRGGEGDNTGILVNGQKLLQPFHVRDFQSLFSAIDSRIADSIEVYSGGFPAQYGNQLSGLVLIDSLTPEQAVIREIGLSVFNTSVFSAGTLGEHDAGKWLVSARRGNLDWILNKDYGEPKYYDVFAEISHPLTSATDFSFNALHANDQVVLSTEADPVEDEISTSRVNNTNLWMQLRTRWSTRHSSNTSFSLSRLNLDRDAVNDQENKLLGVVADSRDVDVFGLRQDWIHSLTRTHTLRWGGEYQRLSASYDYAAAAEYRDFYTDYETIAGNIQRQLRPRVEGEIYSVYVSDQWRLNRKFLLNYGARWDRQTYSDIAADRSMFSPRISFSYQQSDSTAVTISWGRYFQSQDIADLQVEDGLTRFNPAQRSDQAILGIQHGFGGDLSLRIELYRNSVSSVMPRFENLHDPIALIPEFEPDRVRVAPARGRSWGVELSLAREGVDNVDWWLSYVLSRAEDKVDGVWELRGWDQRHAVQAGILYDNERWQISAAANVHSGWPTTTLLTDPGFDSEEPVLVIGPRNRERLGMFASLDVKIARNFQFKSGTLHAFFEVANLTGRNNECCTDFTVEETVDGSEFLEGAREYGLPLLPAIGVQWKF